MKTAIHRWVLLLLGIGLASTLPEASFAYNPRTHQNVSSAAFALSGISSTFQAYGIRPSDRFRLRFLAFPLTSHTPEEWIRLGGSAEDEPPNRVLNHFYDPAHDAPGILGAARAPDWALEDPGDLNSQNHSYRDARNAFYAGLTLGSRTARERELGHTFFTLGHVIHMIQDMAQPQHTRGDLHPPFTSRASLIEEYVEQNITAFTLDAAALPSVTIPRDLWVNSASSGLAQFSNANFVSAGTNFTELREGAKAERFDSPVLRLSEFNSSADTCIDGTRTPDARVPLIFYENGLNDPVTGNGFRNPRMTTYSIFDQHLKASGFRLVFALNCFNIDSAADILLPRAVAYSAALLKYFFRGRLEVRTGGGGLHIRNTTPGEAMAGDFELYYDTSDGSRVRVSRWNLGLASGAESDALPVPPLLTDTPPAEPGKYFLVFRGALGEEADAIAGTWFTIEPIRGVWQTSLLYFDLGPPLNIRTTYNFTDPAPSLIYPPFYFIHKVSYYKFLGGSFGLIGSLELLYRNPDDAPGNTLSVSVAGGCAENWPMNPAITPALADFVAFGDPLDLDVVRTYRFEGPLPAVSRILQTVSIAPDAQNLALDISGVRFLGLRLRSLPPGYPTLDPPPGVAAYNECSVFGFPLEVR